MCWVLLVLWSWLCGVGSSGVVEDDIGGALAGGVDGHEWEECGDFGEGGCVDDAEVFGAADTEAGV